MESSTYGCLHETSFTFSYNLASSSHRKHLFCDTRVSPHERFHFFKKWLKLGAIYTDTTCLFIFICQIIGKQPNSDVWVFNADVQMDASGNVIPLEERKFILEGKRNDHVVNVPSGKPNHWINLTACIKVNARQFSIRAWCFLDHNFCPWVTRKTQFFCSHKNYINVFPLIL